MHGCLYTIDDTLYSAESDLTYYTAQDYINVIDNATHTNESFDSGVSHLVNQENVLMRTVVDHWP